MKLQNRKQKLESKNGVLAVRLVSVFCFPYFCFLLCAQPAPPVSHASRTNRAIVRQLTLTCVNCPGAIGVEFQQGMASGVYTNHLYLLATNQGTFTNLPLNGRVFCDAISFNALGQDSDPCPEISFSGWGEIVTISSPVTDTAQSTPSLYPASWSPFALPWVATNPPGSLFVRGAGVAITTTPYPNP